MPDIEIPEIVTELLKPVSSEAPAGEDVSKSDDPVASAAYADVEMQLGQMGEIDYQLCAQKAVEILQKYSKHLRVAAWLNLCWYRIEGLSGFRNGLLLLLELLKGYGDKVFPEKPTMRSKAIQYLNIDKRFQLLEKEHISGENTRIMAEIQQLFKQISDECQKQFADSLPNLTHITEIINEKAKLVSEETKDTISEETESTSTSSETKPAAESVETPPEESTASSATEEAVTETKTDSQPASAEAGTLPETEAEAPAEEPGIEIPGEVLDLLEDISSAAPAGGDAENSEDQDTWVIYMNLESETGKFGNNDYEQCIKWASQILQQKSKHLRVAVWLYVAWFRQAEIAGTNLLASFRNGLLLLTELLKKYGDQLYPAETAQRSQALQLLNTDTRLKLLGKIEADEKNAEELAEIGRIFSEFENICREQFSENPPKLTSITQVINEKAQSARELIKKAAEREKQAEAKADTGAAEPNTAEARAAQKTADRKPAPSATAAGSPAPRQGVPLSGEKDAIIAIKNALVFFFEPESNNKDSRKVPENASVYGISRGLRWGKLGLPPDKEKVTQIEGPNPQKQNFIRQMLSSKDFDTLIPEIEINFLNREDFLFWLDVQRFVVQALEQKGGGTAEAAQEIKIHLARLLNRLPGLPKLLFKDKQTPFADTESLTWLEEDVKSAVGGGKSVEKILPPIMGEDYQPINQMYEEACSELPQKFEENLKAMQETIAAETRQKGRFLRLLSLANYCYSARRYTLAKALFNQLIEKIKEYNIVEWERALCVSVWQSVYKTNLKLLNSEINSNQKATIEQQQMEMFDRIAKYDSVLALNLTNHEPNQGE
jgi:type VI secretion system ImpA/VasJ family protein